MKRRHALVSLSMAVGAGLGGLPALAQAQVQSLNDAINKAGRQRMLSQRMSKAWLAQLQASEATRLAPQVLERSVALFERQLGELRLYAPSADLRSTYDDLGSAWGDYKATLTEGSPVRERAGKLLTLDSRVLALAHQGTVQYEATLSKPVGKLVNVAGRQRMLSQRMAKFYFVAALQIEKTQSLAEIAKARTEFVAATELLRNAPEATPAIRDQLALADNQWFFFDQALNNIQQASPKALSDVFVASENLLSVMDQVTGLYAGLKA